MKIFLAGLAVLVLSIVGIQSANADDKLDGDCTGHETVGRCADKCPEGYYQQGIDKDTGAAVCKPNEQTDPTSQPTTSQPSQTQPDEVQVYNLDPSFSGK